MFNVLQRRIKKIKIRHNYIIEMKNDFVLLYLLNQFMKLGHHIILYSNIYNLKNNTFEKLRPDTDWTYLTVDPPFFFGPELS
jgi:hypothetical protein